jgi:hypothetical protein
MLLGPAREILSKRLTFENSRRFWNMKWIDDHDWMKVLAPTKSRVTDHDWFKCSIPSSAGLSRLYQPQNAFLRFVQTVLARDFADLVWLLHSAPPSACHLLPLCDHSRFAASFCIDSWPLITADSSLDIQRLMVTSSSFGVQLSMSECDGPKPTLPCLCTYRRHILPPNRIMWYVRTRSDGGYASLTSAAAREPPSTGVHRDCLEAHQNCIVRPWAVGEV